MRVSHVKFMRDKRKVGFGKKSSSLPLWNIENITRLFQCKTPKTPDSTIFQKKVKKDSAFKTH